MKSLEELRAIRESMRGPIGIRTENDETTRVVVGMATCGIAAGARSVLNRLVSEVQESNLRNVVVEQTGCIGSCAHEPIVEIFAPGKDKVTYIDVDAEKAAEIVRRHLLGGEVIAAYTLNDEER